MLSSQVLETGIGVVFVLIILSTAASAVLDLVRRGLNSRSKDLEAALRSFFATPPANTPAAQVTRSLRHLWQTVGTPTLDPAAEEAWRGFQRTSIYQGALAARGQVRPAYLSAKAFAEAVDEQLRDTEVTGPLKVRVDALVKSALPQHTIEFRAGLERWFDEAMAGLSSRYRKRSTLWLFLLGLLLCGALNASVPHMAQQLWTDSATRAVVVAAADSYDQPTSAPTQTPADAIEDVAAAADDLTELGLPLGWNGQNPSEPWWWPLHGLGWILTAALISLGGPFWFDLLNRLTALRSPRPAPAADDATSATRIVATAPPAGGT